MRSFLKGLVFGEGVRPRKVLLGAGRGLKVMVDPAVQSQRLLGLAELEVSGEFTRLAHGARTFCDVGASDGWYCLLARKHNPGIRIVAFEPEAQLGAIAREHFALNGIDAAEVAWREEFCGTDGTSLDEALRGLERPIFIKMDIEGGELDALRSGLGTIREQKCFLLVETHSKRMEEECAKLLEASGYAVRIIPKGWYRRWIPETRPLAHNQWMVAVAAKNKTGFPPARE